MKFGRKQKFSPRSAKPSQGRSMSVNSYYRPQSRPAQNFKAEVKADSKPNNKSVFKTSTLINGLIAFSFLILLFFATTLSSSPDIKFTDDSYIYRNKEQYSTVAKDILNDSVLNRSKVLFKSRSFESSMIEKFPEISTIEAIVPLGGRDLTVSMKLSPPLSTVSNGSLSGIVDTNGILITDERSQSASTLFNLRFATPQENFTVGSAIITSSEVNLLSLLELELAGLNLKGVSANDGNLTLKEVLFNVSDGQFEASLNEVPYIIKLSAYADAEEQVGATKVSLKELHETSQPPTAYLDVRVPGRVFVK